MRTILIACLALIVSACSQESAEAEHAIRTTYDKYAQAILERRGADAVKLLDQNTIDYYGQLLNLARSGAEKEVRARSVADKVTTLLLRHRVSSEKLAAMSPHSVFVFIVDSGSINRNAETNNELGHVVVSGDHATGVFVAQGIASQHKYRFSREDGEWKLDLTSLLTAANVAMRRVVEQSGKSEDDFVVQIVELTSGTSVSEDIWKSRDGT